jgi:hypothetical protein
MTTLGIRIVNGSDNPADWGHMYVAQYANLRIWRDLNQDGISQSNELKTLQDSGVTSIQLAGSTIRTNYGDAILAQSSTYTNPRKGRPRIYGEKVHLKDMAADDSAFRVPHGTQAYD